MKPRHRRLLANLGRAAIAGGLGAVTLMQTAGIGYEAAGQAFAYFALLWLAGAYEVDIRDLMAQRPRNRVE